jgi:hypothetical protein
MWGEGLAPSAGPSRSPVVGVAWSDKVIRLLNITSRPWITGTGARAIRRMQSARPPRTAGTGQHSERRSDGPMDQDQDDDVIGDDERIKIKASEVAKAGDGNEQVKEGFLWSGSLAA